MPLTPAEVHNVVFKKPPIGKRGYDEEEVDAFLDIIEVELARLIEENKDLRDRLDKGGVGAPPVAAGADGAALAAARDENKRLAARVSELDASLAQAKQAAAKAQQDLAVAEQEANAAKQRLSQTGGEAAALVAAQEENKKLGARVTEAEAALARAQQDLAQARAAAPVGGAAAGAVAGGVTQLSQAERVLSLAQQAADEQTAAAKAHHEKTVADAKAHQERVHSDAKAFQDKTVAEAQARADQLDRDSKAKAANTVQEAEQRANQITTQLEQRKAALEKRLEELRTFEHEYRSRLKSYLESQLRDLDASGPAEPGSGVKQDGDKG
jgi:DivIVA domain-containing protein